MATNVKLSTLIESCHNEQMIRLLLLTFLLHSCLKPAQVKNQQQIIHSMASAIEQKYPKINHMEVEEFRNLKSDSFILVDIRSPKERQVSTIPGSIDKNALKSMPESTLEAKQIIFFCTIGERSSRYATEYQQQNQKLKVSNLHGSILSWIQKGGSLQDLSKQETKKVHVYSEAWSFVPKDFEPVWN